MAKGNSGAEDRAKVKLRVIEFELEGGNAAVENSIKQLTAALTGNKNGSGKLAAAPGKHKELAAGVGEEVVDAEVVEEETDEVEAEAPATKKAPSKKGKPKPPTYIHDLMTADQITAFKAFAAEKKPTSKSKQYLVATHWLKENGVSDTVNADKIYTCFKTAGWSTGFNDWAQPFHNLVHSEHLRKATNPSEFAINPLGEDAVTKGTDA